MSEIEKPIIPIMVDSMHPNAKAVLAQFTNPLRRQFFYCVGWLAFLAVVFSLLNFVPFFRPAEESVGTWLERSGALIGICAMVVESRLKIMNNVLGNASLVLASDLFEIVNRYEKHVSYLHGAVLFYAAVWALIWSYGSPLLRGFITLTS